MSVRDEQVRRGSDRTLAVAVYGAAGHTGRFVVSELVRRGLDVIAIGRDPAKLAAAGFSQGTKLRSASIDDPAAVAGALAGASAVINCAGPFLDTATAVVEAALQAGIFYLDVSAEQASVLTLFEEQGRAAEAAGVAVVPAMAFWGGLGDLLATAAMRDWEQADEIRIGVALDSWRPTEGTRTTGRRNTVPRVVVSGGTLQLAPHPAPTMTWPFSAPLGPQEVVGVPLTEAILLGRRRVAPEVRHYVNAAPLRDLSDPATPPPIPADSSGRSDQTFLVEVEVQRAGEVRRASANGRDIYAITAPLVVEAVERLLNRPPARGGVFAPGELFPAQHFLQALAPELTFRSSC